MNRHVHRATVYLVAAALAATACGMQLSDEDIALYAGSPGADVRTVEGSVTGPGTGPAGDGAGDGGQADEGDDPADSDDGGTDGGAATPGTSGSASEPDGGADGSDGGTGGTGGTGGDDDGAGNPGGDGGGTDTRAAPPGGNGGATDVGVTEDSITIYNVSDRTGAIPALFQDAQEAVAAYFLKFQKEQGTVHGRSINLVQRDSKLSAQENRSAYLDACNEAFAAVGSMSAFEQGAANPISQCGIPDLRTAAVNDQIQVLESVVSVDAMKPGFVPMSEWSYYAEQFPGAITKAGYLWIDNATTTYQTDQNRRATASALGYDWIAEIPIALSEVNYASIVQQLKDKGVELVAFQGDPRQAARIARTMQQQNYAPKVFALQSNAYQPVLIEECGATCEQINVSVAQTGALVEEIQSNPEMQDYATWLARVNPRAVPTGLGMYGWAAAKVFVETITEIGPELTRAKLLAALRARTAYTADDLIPPQDFTTQEPTDCIILLRIEGGRFVRETPADGYRCRDRAAQV